MTNFEKWRAVCDGLVSPDSYINTGYYYLIAASLQRRVWFGPDHMKLYPNQYTVFVGPPGVGKGLVLKLIDRMLRYHRLQDPKNTLEKVIENPSIASTVDKEQLTAVAQANYKVAKETDDEFSGKKKDFFDQPLLIPVAANASTFEALTRAMAKSIRRKDYREYDKDAKKEVMKIYTHSSLCFCLEEMASLFRRKTHDLVNFLLQAYDCSEEYTYDTKTLDLKDRIRKLCLNFLAGTTPSFMRDTFDDRLLTEGFASRSLFVYEMVNRKHTTIIPDLTEEQQKYMLELLVHIKSLTKLYGRVRFTAEANAFYEEWWIKSQTDRPNTSIKLEPYYARKNILLPKMAMAMHFGESSSMEEIGVETLKNALNFLAPVEKKMHYALSFDKKNPLAAPAKNVMEFITKQGRKTKREIFTEFWGNLPPPVEESLNEILTHLKITHQIVEQNEINPKTNAPIIYYELPSKAELGNK